MSPICGNVPILSQRSRTCRCWRGKTNPSLVHLYYGGWKKSCTSFIIGGLSHYKILSIFTYIYIYIGDAGFRIHGISYDRVLLPEERLSLTILIQIAGRSLGGLCNLSAGRAKHASLLAGHGKSSLWREMSHRKHLCWLDMYRLYGSYMVVINYF